MDDTEFDFSAVLPETLKDGIFCPACFHAHAEPVLDQYREHLEKARQVNTYDISQGNETSRIRRIEKPIKVENCGDKKEALMKLAFLAAQKGFDTLVDVDIQQEKVGTGTYKKLIWHGKAVPVDPKVRK